MEGWIKLWRKVWDNKLFKERRSFSKFEAWIDMLLMADHSDKTHLINDEWIHCKRGEFPISDQFLAVRWMWSRNKVRHFLKELEKEHQTNTNRTKRGTIIHIINYNSYQGEGITEGTTEGTSEGTTEGTQYKKIRSKEIKNKDIYGEFSNVKLTKEEYAKLVEKFGEASTKEKIENLSIYIASKGKKYANHYATILTWDRKNPKPLQVSKKDEMVWPNAEQPGWIEEALQKGWK
jgi:DNA replication protein DnaD